MLQKVCHDAAALACGAEPRYFPRESLDTGADLVALLRWSRELSRLAEEADHPWIADLGVESLVEQGRQALKTARSERRPRQAVSLNSPR
jgi:DNA polymerase-3 subunit delta'